MDDAPALAVLKYKECVCDIPDCPPGACVEEVVTVYRFVREDISDPWNFTPQAVKNPQRKFKDDEEMCSGYALSMWRSESEAEAFYSSQIKKRKQARLYLGTHLASVKLTPSEGKLTATRRDGHRDLHEYTSARCDSVATLVRQLYFEDKNV